MKDILNGLKVTVIKLYMLSLKLPLTKFKRGITKKIYIRELRFLRSAHRLMLVNISMMFHEHILNVFLSYRADTIL